MAEKLELIISATDNTKKSFSAVSKGLKGLGNLALGGIAVGATAAIAGVAGLGVGLYSAVGAAADAEEEQAALNAVLESTNGIAGVTADMANDLASSLQDVTRFGNDAILSGENLLLTFTNIGKDVFPDATAIMLDMSQALGQDLKSSAIQLGKALNDPVAGITALQRVGVSFTDEQKEMVADMVEAGDVMGAQKFILAELNREFGGAAAAAGETFAGKLDILRNKFGDIMKTIGGALLPMVSNLASVFINVLNSPMVQEAIQTITGLIENIGIKFSEIITMIAGAIAGDPLATDALGEKFGTIGIILGDVVTFIKETLIPGIIAFATETLPLLFDKVKKVFGWIKRQVVPILEIWYEKLSEFLVPKLIEIKDTVLPLFFEKLKEVWGWIKKTAIPIIDDWAKKFEKDLMPKIADLYENYLTTMFDRAEKIWNWIKDTAIPTIGNWGESYRTGLQPHIEKISELLRTFQSDIQPKLVEAWGKLSDLWGKVRDLLKEHLWPAVDRITKALGLNEEGSGKLLEVVGFLLGKFLEFEVTGILMTISTMLDILVIAIDAVSLAIDGAAVFIDIFSGGIVGLIEFIRQVKSDIDQLRDAFGTIGDKLPDWLIPGSPTPLEIGLRGISDAMSNVTVGFDTLPNIDAGSAGRGNPAIGGGNVYLTYAPAVSLGSRYEVETVLMPFIQQGVRQAMGRA